MNRKADAIIIGAGVIGSSVAFELAKHSTSTNCRHPDTVQRVIRVPLCERIIQLGTVLRWPTRDFSIGTIGRIIWGSKTSAE